MHWFDYESLVIFLFVELLPEIIHLLRENPCLWEKVVLIGEYLGHPHEVSAEVILARQLIHSRVMIYALVRLKLGELFRGCATHITPVDVPIASFVLHHFEAELFEGFANDDITALSCA